MNEYFEIITDAVTGEQTRRDFTPEEIEALKAAQLASAAESVRAQRDALLTGSDWTQLPDAPVDQLAWAVYRHALRNITSQPGFPENVVWPVAP